MTDLLDITARVSQVAVMAPGGAGPMICYADGRHFYFADTEVARIAAHLTGVLDVSGRDVRVERASAGWQEQRGNSAARVLHRREINGTVHYRFDEEWLFTVVSPEPVRHHTDS